MTGRTTTIAVNAIATLALAVAVVVTLLVGGGGDASSTATSPEVGAAERTSTSSGSAIRRLVSSVQHRMNRCGVPARHLLRPRLDLMARSRPPLTLPRAAPQSSCRVLRLEPSRRRRNRHLVRVPLRRAGRLPSQLRLILRCVPSEAAEPARRLLLLRPCRSPRGRG